MLLSVECVEGVHEREEGEKVYDECSLRARSQHRAQ